MESVLLWANVRRHRVSLLGIGFLIFLSALLSTAVLSIRSSGMRTEQEELSRLGYGNLTAWVSADEGGLTALEAELEAQEAVEEVTVQPLIFSDYEINGQDSDSEGQMVLYQPEQFPYRFFNEELSGYTQGPETIEEGTVYLPASMVSMYGASVGDTIHFFAARQGGTLSLTVAGFFEDPFMGSSMIGMKSVLVSEETLEEGQVMLAGAGMDALAREGGMLHITSAEPKLPAAQLNRILYEETSLASRTDFLYSADTIAGFMMTLQNVFTGFLLAFAAVLIVVALVVIRCSLESGIQRDTANMGILKTMGMTGGSLKLLWLAQYLIPVTAGIGFGTLAALPVSRLAGQLMVATTGVLLRPSVPLGLWACYMLLLLLLFGGFIYARTGKINRISPLEAIGSAGALPAPEGSFHVPIKGEGMIFWLGFRQLMDGKRRYISVCLTAMLLVFFASMAGRLSNWLGPEGQGLMDAFNPADLDLAVQPLNDVDMEEVEDFIRRYTEITGRYSLAMSDVAVEGVDYTANVITEPERFHLLRGRGIEGEDEILVTEFVAEDLGISPGDTVSVSCQGREADFTVAGIYQCANEMGANIGMSREGFGRIGTETPSMWCRHYFLADISRKGDLISALEHLYGGALYIHENSWPGLSGILSAMKLLMGVLYLTAALFSFTVTVLTGNRLLLAEQKDLEIYRSIGFTSGQLRRSFALRFGIVSLAGALGGSLLGAVLTDPLVGAVLRGNGISNFHSHWNLAESLFPAGVITLLFSGFSYIYSAKVKEGESKPWSRGVISFGDY